MNCRARTVAACTPAAPSRSFIRCRSSTGACQQPGDRRLSGGFAGVQQPSGQKRGAARAATSSRRQPGGPSSSSSGSGVVIATSSGSKCPPAAPAAACNSPARLVKPQGASNNILELNEFRRGVGLCIYRADGLVFAARRMDDTEQSWQMPQGGIDPLENPMTAARRELFEETAMTSCRIVGSIDHWLAYTFPTKVKAHHDAASFLRYRGQTQKWFLIEFFGDDSEIDLSCHGHPEFSEYSWQPLEALPAGVVDFKRGVYERVAREFAPQIALRVGTRI